eukprot:1365153-Amorphochlora_amoeboformis.AAC.1
MTQYSDEDLTVSIARMLLCVPRELIDIPVILPAVRRLFKIGLSYHSTASFAMDVVERWQATLPEFKLYLGQIVPFLNDYISSSAIRNPVFNVEDLPEGDNSEDVVLPEETDMNMESDAPFRLFLRIMRFLGRIGGRSHYLLDDGRAGKEVVELHISSSLTFSNYLIFLRGFEACDTFSAYADFHNHSKPPGHVVGHEEPYLLCDSIREPEAECIPGPLATDCQPPCRELARPSHKICGVRVTALHLGVHDRTEVD